MRDKIILYGILLPIALILMRFNWTLLKAVRNRGYATIGKTKNKKVQLKETEIEAFQYNQDIGFNNDSSLNYVPDWIFQAFFDNKLFFDTVPSENNEQPDFQLFFKNKAGIFLIEDKDWLIRTTSGEIYFYKHKEIPKLAQKE